MVITNIIGLAARSILSSMAADEDEVTRMLWACRVLFCLCDQVLQFNNAIEICWIDSRTHGRIGSYPCFGRDRAARWVTSTRLCSVILVSSL